MTNRSRNDSPQLDLLGGLSASPGEAHSLFLALLPDRDTRDAIDQVASSLRASLPHWRARWIDPSRYHATLHFLGDHADPRPDLEAAVTAAAKKIDATTFTWTLDRVDSFHGRQPPCVLLGAEMPEAMQAMWDHWRSALILAGQGAHLERRFTPHVTLAYAQEDRRDATPIDVIPWTVDEVALVRSASGRPDYEILGRWPLRSPDIVAQ